MFQRDLVIIKMQYCQFSGTVSPRINVIVYNTHVVFLIIKKNLTSNVFIAKIIIIIIVINKFESAWLASEPTERLAARRPNRVARQSHGVSTHRSGDRDVVVARHELFQVW